MKKNKIYYALFAISTIALLASNSWVVNAREQITKDNSDYQSYCISSGEISYYSFDDLETPENGGYSPGYFPNGCEELHEQEVLPAAVVGSDNRTKIDNTAVGPYCNTVYVSMTFSDGKTYRGSGFMIGPKAVVTAGHCLYNRDKQEYATSVTVIPAKNGNTEPYGSATASARNLIVSSDYISKGGADYDWGIIELDTDLGSKTGWLGLRTQGDSYDNTYVWNTGYPTVVNGKNVGTTMYVGKGYVKSSSTYTFKGTWDASGGNSGGPVFANYESTGYTAIGILTTGSADSTFGEQYPTAYSTATRITNDMYNLFIQYR